jgi:oxygen-independent coproporphyrinogen-3 oxidase
MPEFLYIHIPFCIRKCIYCDFLSVPYDESFAKKYVDALCKELILKKDSARILKTIYLGGGTPSLLADECFIKLFNCLRNNFDFSPSTEITVEANPGTINNARINTLLSLGINRLSIGVQSFNDNELRILGRVHTSNDAARSIELIRESGINNFSIDLMYGIPGQTLDSWQNTISKAVGLSPTHISTYELTLEENTPLYKLMKSNETLSQLSCEVTTSAPPLPAPLRRARPGMGGDKGEGENEYKKSPSPSPIDGEGILVNHESELRGTPFLKLPDEELILKMYNHVIDYLASFGYEHYEISNFALPRFRCMHNLNYWDRGEYIGAGAGAHSFFNGMRSKNTEDIKRYIKDLNNEIIPETESTKLTSTEALKEFIFLGLRKTEGININEPPPFIPTLPRWDIGGCGRVLLDACRDLVYEGYIEIARGYLRLTRKGIVISNTIIVKLFERLGL